MNEEEIRPQRIFNEYLRLAKEDANIYFGSVDRVSGSCPACETIGLHAFVKDGFSYDTCPNCLSLFVNPRPLAQAFSRYYTESASAEFWATTFYKETAESRRKKIWQPKARMVLDILERYGASDHAMVDIGGGFGIFAEEVKRLCGRAPIIIEPGPKLAAACREKSLQVIPKFLEEVLATDLPAESRAFVSFELFEHLHDPSAFLGHLNKLMAQGDLFIFTTLSGTGVDIQALWEDSKSVTPPHHLNFLNPYSIKLLLSRLGFESLEVTTPGTLDIDIMTNNHPAIKDRFWQTFLSMASDAQKADWQQIISKSGWSSHMMVVCRKF